MGIRSQHGHALRHALPLWLTNKQQNSYWAGLVLRKVQDVLAKRLPILRCQCLHTTSANISISIKVIYMHGFMLFHAASASCHVGCHNATPAG